MNYSELLLRLHIFLVGRSTEVSLENRIFHTVCLISCLVTGYNIIFNFATGLYFTGSIFLVLTGVIFYLYYLSKFKNRIRYSIPVICLLVALLFAANYFYSYGVGGASLLSFTILFFLTMIISPKKLYWFWFIFFNVLIWGLLLFEYASPELVAGDYGSIQTKIIDLGSTVTINIILIFLGLFYLKEIYYREKSRSDQKTIALSKMNDNKTKLFSVLSHDLRSPLHSISSYLEMIKGKGLSPNEQLEVEEMLSITVHNTQDMLTNILDWSKVQLSNVPPDLTNQFIAPAIASTLKTYKVEAKRKNIHFEQVVDTEVSAVINASMMQVVVRNLLANALKFTNAGGRVVIQLQESPDGALISIQDTGKGIPRKEQSNIFSLNVASTYGTMNEKGVGLGLYLCKENVLAQKGRIWFESEEGKGTTFFVEFPMLAKTPEKILPREKIQPAKSY